MLKHGLPMALLVKILYQVNQFDLDPQQDNHMMLLLLNESYHVNIMILLSVCIC